MEGGVRLQAGDARGVRAQRLLLEPLHHVGQGPGQLGVDVGLLVVNGADLVVRDVILLVREVFLRAEEIFWQLSVLLD